MRKRSKYRPKPIIADTMTWVRAGMKRVDEVSASATIKIRNHDAMNTLRLGAATRLQIDTIIDAMNIAEALAKRGFGSDWLPELQDAQDKLLELARRGVANGFRFIVRGDELTALNMAMEIHDAQLEAVTVKELETAMHDVMENLRLKKMRPILETV
jgi:hypothetical protein